MFSSYTTVCVGGLWGIIQYDITSCHFTATDTYFTPHFAFFLHTFLNVLNHFIAGADHFYSTIPTRVFVCAVLMTPVTEAVTSEKIPLCVTGKIRRNSKSNGRHKRVSETRLRVSALEFPKAWSQSRVKLARSCACGFDVWKKVHDLFIFLRQQTSAFFQRRGSLNVRKLRICAFVLLVL